MLILWKLKKTEMPYGMVCLPFNGFLREFSSPIGANIYSLFASVVAGATDHLCDWAELDVSLFAFESERWEEEELLWYFRFVIF
jgi:hypothetical protein